MFKNYVKTVIRNLRRNKSYTIINFLGLTIGIAACLLLFMVIQFELSYDNFHTKRDRIYRMVSVLQNPDGVNYISGTPYPLTKALRLDYPQLEKAAATYYDYGREIIVPGNNGEILKKFKVNVMFAEPEFFEVFDFKSLSGDPKTILAEPYSVMLSKETAEKYFGDCRSAIGKTLKLNDNILTKVKGILENTPTNTDFPLKIVVSYSTLQSARLQGSMNDWVSINAQANSYVVLAPGYSASQFSASLPAFTKKHKPTDFAKDGFSIQPLSELHYDSRFSTYAGPTFSKELIRALKGIGLFLLIIACINFVNLATAQAVNRAREVGVRKVLGSSRRQLLIRFMAETAVICLFAVLAAVLLAMLTLDSLNSLLSLRLAIEPLTNPTLLLFLFVILVSVTLLSGFYPALVLSGFNPINALKSKTISARGISLRRVLVVLQFVIAQVLIVCVLVITSQMDYFQNADLGFNKEAVLDIRFPNDSLAVSKIKVLRQQLSEQPGVQQVSFSYAAPSDYSAWFSDFRYDNSPKKTDFGACLRWADTGYFRLYGLKFIAGHLYQASDTVKEYVINETCLHKLGVTSPWDAIGKKIDLWDGAHTGFIVGVIKDFHINPLRDPISPVIMSTWNDVYGTLNVKTEPDKAKETIVAIAKMWDRFFPSDVFEYQFLDQKIATFYTQENQLSWLYRIFAGIAIFISCLGLYGMISFMAVQRNKEIGIRKVLGATVNNIVFLLSKEFTLLIVIAFAIATPIAWYFMHQWLQQYTFRIHLGPIVFVMTILSSIIIAWLTVGYRSFRAAWANPVKSLRSE